MKVLDGDRTNTNYRLDISREKPIHRSTILLNLREIKWLIYSILSLNSKIFIFLILYFL